MEEHGGKMGGDTPIGELDLYLENKIASVITLEIAQEELMYGRDMCKNPEKYEVLSLSS